MQQSGGLLLAAGLDGGNTGVGSAGKLFLLVSQGQIHDKIRLDQKSIDNFVHLPYIQDGGVFMNKETFGQFIADMRHSSGLTQQALAEHLHVTNSAVSKWERGLCFPDITILEKLAGALGLTLTELVACERAEDNGPHALCAENSMSSLLDIANESHRKQKRRILRNTLLSALLVVLLVFSVYLLVLFSKIYIGSAVYIGCQASSAQDYVYLDNNGSLLRLRCQDSKMYQDIVSGQQTQRYTIEYRWNPITQDGVLLRVQADQQYLGSPMDTLGSLIEIDSLLGFYAVKQKITNVYPDPNHPYDYIYTLTYYRSVEGKTYEFLTVNQCRKFAFCDYDNDGVVELFILTIYDNAPYMLYDTKDGIPCSCFVDTVPEGVFDP